ncbi:hypothetical protein [Chitinophaga sp. S165]|uniref:hypothetical protein n=1 Tax=Chitinophaga sp. S165 TaxID=2135462 RepID=UPI000D70A6BF|nr:hypothetical protein [Chitinophaga sp. S165]PWV55518.1 hypothetical protein C7475_10124 [Chitinophaga sp. S165]
MNKIRLTVTAAAAWIGMASAIAANVRHGSSEIVHDWIDWNNQTIIVNATQEEAQYLCTSASTVCLRAKDNVFIYTTGNLPW